ncbi:nucleotide disphospho-sugar-binding domain-containing protein [Kitasatospora sp. NPDC088134]|uniref:nucleotide disphospho-sugar-binding domain-containing protein n=1 Tax=Kitasatospora sp. NPDC088134 TaxID=3364071 RepID=UPI00381F6088
MRVLFLTTPVPTHFSTLVTTAWAFRQAGHEVVVAGQPDIAATAHAAGLPTVTIGDWNDAVFALGALLPPGKRLIDTKGRPDRDDLVAGTRVWVVHAKYLLPQYLEFARAYRPDLIVADMVEYTSLIVGGVLGVPVVQQRWGTDRMSSAALDSAREALGPLCRRLGLDGLPDPAVMLDPTPPELQAPESPGTPIRYVTFNGSGTAPAWLWAPKPAARRVVVTLGSHTMRLNGVPHVRRILEAFDGLPDTEALATVEEKYRAEIGPVPANVRMVDPVPLGLVLGSCDAVVHHGGVGTALTATAAGLPQLVLPQLLDMFTVGDLLAQAGAGLTLDTAETQDDVPGVRKALGALLDDPGYAAAADRLAGSMAAMPSPARVVADLEQLV